MVKNFYVVINGKIPGIYETWSECKLQVDGFPNAKFKGFCTKEEADEYIKHSDSNVKKFNLKRKFQNETVDINNDKKCKVVENDIWHPTQLIYSVAREFDKNGAFQNISLLCDNTDGNRICVYTDGSCKKTKKGCIAGYGVYWGPNCPWNAAERYEGVQTNNRAEIAAVIKAVETASKYGIKKLLIVTDSQFTINCMTKWIKKWKKNNWIISANKEAECRDVLEKLDDLIHSTKIDLKWKHVRGHMGNKGNEEADKLANLGADNWLLL